MRHGYSEQEGDWIDAVCGVMNRWAMAAAAIEAEARLWATPPEHLDAAAQPRQAHGYYQAQSPDHVSPALY